MAHHNARWFVGFCASGHTLAIVLAFFLILGSISRTRAHGDASWIMKNPDFGWCCGPKDCFWLDHEEVRIDGDDYVVDRFSIRWSIIGTFPSKDDHFWACYYMEGTENRELKCLFAPARGS